MTDGKLAQLEKDGGVVIELDTRGFIFAADRDGSVFFGEKNGAQYITGEYGRVKRFVQELTELFDLWSEEDLKRVNSPGQAGTVRI